MTTSPSPCTFDVACEDYAVVRLHRERGRSWPVCDRHAHVAALEAERFGYDVSFTALASAPATAIPRPRTRW